MWNAFFRRGKLIVTVIFVFYWISFRFVPQIFSINVRWHSATNSHSRGRRNCQAKVFSAAQLLDVHFDRCDHRANDRDRRICGRRVWSRLVAHASCILSKHAQTNTDQRLDERPKKQFWAGTFPAKRRGKRDFLAHSPPGCLLHRSLASPPGCWQ